MNTKSTTEMASLLNNISSTIASGPTLSDTTNSVKSSNHLSSATIGTYLQTTPTLSSTVLWFTILFFSCMVGMEIALESAMNNFPGLDSLATSVTLFQLGCCVIFPLMLSKGTALQQFPRRTKEFVPYVFLSFLVFGSTGLANSHYACRNYHAT
jgi:hypothetical protein